MPSKNKNILIGLVVLVLAAIIVYFIMNKKDVKTTSTTTTTGLAGLNLGGILGSLLGTGTAAAGTSDPDNSDGFDEDLSMRGSASNLDTISRMM